jgi:DNA invertase Pin-like site-specific DNA recombinase
MPEVISYVRWSSQEQSKGNSSDRQEEAVIKWLKAHSDYTLDLNRRYRDAGVSGRGAHLDGALGTFMKEAVNDKFKPGTVLLVEALDRLGRMAPYKQMGLFLTIIGKGITVVTTIDGAEYSGPIMESPDGQWKLMQSLVKMNLAWEESEKKAHRSGDNWKRIRKGEKKKVGTKRVPGWIRVSPDGEKYELIPERVKIVRQIFQLTAAGWGKDRIAKKLYEDGVETWGPGKKKARRWRDSYISKVLSNPAVIGQFQWHESPALDPNTGKKIRKPIGEPEQNHFPPAIKHSVWAAVQKIRAAREKRPGRVGDNVRNLFTGLVYCGHTGESITFSNKSPHYYLRSSALKAPKGVRLKPWIYEDYEKAFFETVGRLNPRGLIEPSTAPERESLLERIAELESSATSLTKTIHNLVTSLGNDEIKPIPEVNTALANADKKRIEVNEQIRQAKHELESVTGGSAVNEALASIQAIREKRHDPAFRLRLRDYLGNLVEGIFIYLDGEAVFKKSVSACFNFSRGGARAGVAALRLYLEQSSRPKARRAPDNARNAARVRAFSIAFKNGGTRTVIVTQKRDAMYAVALNAKRRKIVQDKNGLTHLHRQDEDQGIWMWENAINLTPADFPSQQEYLNFLKSYHNAYPTIYTTDARNTDWPKNQVGTRS